jgi:hypothetical protein
MNKVSEEEARPGAACLDEELEVAHDWGHVLMIQSKSGQGWRLSYHLEQVRSAHESKQSVYGAGASG